MYIFSGQYYQKDNLFHHDTQLNTTGSNYERYSSIPIFDYAVHIESLDPLDSMEYSMFFALSVICRLLICKPIIFLGEDYLLKFRKSNPKAYLLWYANYITKVETQKLILKAKNSDCHATLKQFPDVYVYNNKPILFYIKILLMYIYY